MAPFFRVRFAVERQVPRFVTAGDPFRLRVRVKNLSGRAQRGLAVSGGIEGPADHGPGVCGAAATGSGEPQFRVGGPLPPIRQARTRPEPLPLMPAGGAWRRCPR
jgi:hypothetical protein